MMGMSSFTALRFVLDDKPPFFVIQSVAIPKAFGTHSQIKHDGDEFLHCATLRSG
jgi:hypothetical protein